MMFVVAILALICTAPATAQMTAGRQVQSNVQRVESVSFSKEINIANGPGGPRDYVGLWRVSTMQTDTPENLRKTRIAWKYVDNKNDAATAAERKNATSGPTFGKVIFDKLPPGEYQARFYQNGSLAEADLIGVPVQFSLVGSLELLHYGGATVNVNRVTGAGLDTVTVQYSDGRMVTMRLDSGIVLRVIPVGDPVTTPAVTVAEAP